MRFTKHSMYLCDAQALQYCHYCHFKISKPYATELLVFKVIHFYNLHDLTLNNNNNDNKLNDESIVHCACASLQKGLSVAAISMMLSITASRLYIVTTQHQQ